MSDRGSTHWVGCWRAHQACAVRAVEYLAQASMLVMFETLIADPNDPNGRELEQRFKGLDIPVDWPEEIAQSDGKERP